MKIEITHRVIFEEMPCGTLRNILNQLEDIMAAIDTLTTEVSETRTVMESAKVLIIGLKQKLDDAIASGNPARLQELSDSLDTGANDLAAAVVANTPAETP